MLSDLHAKWLESRRIPIEVASQFDLSSRGNELAFPYQTPTGEPSFQKFRGPEKKFRIDPPGKALQLWLLSRWKDASSTTLKITEGEMDALSFLASGADCVTSVPNGAPSVPGKDDIDPHADRAFSYLWAGDKLHPEIDRFERFILATDADRPGSVLRDELAIRLGRDRCHFVVYPEGCKDANDVLVKHGRQAVLNLIERARPVVPSQLVRFSDIPRSTAVSLSSGWGSLDTHLMLLIPEVMVISGPPNAGKSQWSLALVANLARVHGMRGAILQFEDEPERHHDDLMRYAKAWRHTDKGVGIGKEPMDWVDDMFVTIAPPEGIEQTAEKTLTWLEDRVHEAATRHGCKWVLIDPWNEVEHAWSINESETAYTGRALRHIRALARRYRLAIIIVTHPSKAGGAKTDPKDMTLYDVAGSAHWANKPDHGILIYRPRGSDETVVTVAKSRDYRKRGQPGSVRMRFDFATASFTFIANGTGA